MKTDFPERVCDYSRRLAEREPAFARQAFRSPEEDAPDGYGPDPFGEETSADVLPGVKRRFRDRILVMAAGSCFMNCRHCTRKGILGKARIVDTPEALDAAVRYAAARPEIRDVLVSGGDPLTLGDGEVMRFIDAFAALPSVDAVRLCTRAPCTNPGRITPALAERLAVSRKVWVNTQFNHACELTPEAVAACAEFVDRGIPVSCQTVLLAGVNDSAGAMLALFRALQRARVRPYYVFQCDPIAGISHFRVPLDRAIAIERECAESIGGLALPRFVADLPHARRKTPIAELRFREEGK